MFTMYDSVPKLQSDDADKILGNIFEQCEVTPNTIPMEELESYSNYRAEKYTVQRVAIMIAMVLFVLMPHLFIMPKYTVSASNQLSRGLPVYTIDVENVMSVRRVTAQIGDEFLPVYAVTKKSFTVEPIMNGTLIVNVELSNGQMLQKTIQVATVDNETPKVIGSSTADGEFTIRVEDTGIGVAFEDIFGELENGDRVTPKEIDRSSGMIRFDIPEEEMKVYIPDYLGNTLTLTIRKK